MKLNKTFLLQAVASYTEGSMLIVIDSIEEFKDLYKDYHSRKEEALAEDWESHLKETNYNRWEQVHDKWVEENNLKPFNFEIDTGSSNNQEHEQYSDFKTGIVIRTEKDDTIRSGYWIIVKEFMSDLPKGTHYYGDYCA